MCVIVIDGSKAREQAHEVSFGWCKRCDLQGYGYHRLREAPETLRRRMRRSVGWQSVCCVCVCARTRRVSEHGFGGEAWGSGCGVVEIGGALQSGIGRKPGVGKWQKREKKVLETTKLLTTKKEKDLEEKRKS